MRFLHLLMREVGERIADCRLPFAIAVTVNFTLQASHFALVPSLEVNGQLFQTWQEAVEREVLSVPAIHLDKPGAKSVAAKSFLFPQSETVEPLRDDSGEIVGAHRSAGNKRSKARLRSADFETWELIGTQTP